MHRRSNQFLLLAVAGWFAIALFAARAEFPSFSLLRRMGGEQQESAASIAVTVAATNSYIAGYFGETTAVGSTLLTNLSGYTNLFVAAVAPPNIGIQWAKAPTIDGRIGGLEMVATTATPILAGNFYGTNITFGSQTLTNFGIPGADSPDIFLVGYNFGGSVTFLRQLGGTSRDWVKDAAGLQNNFYVGGWFQSPSFAAGNTNFTLQGTNGADGFLIKYSASGAVTWVRQGINAGVDLVAVDNANNVYAAGTVLGSVAFDALTLSNQTDGTFVVKFNSSGSPLWVRGDLNVGTAWAVDKGQNLVTAGVFSNTLQFGQTVLSNSAIATIYLARYDSNGVVLWARQLEGLGNDRVTTVTTDWKTNCWIAGSFRSPDLAVEHGFVACYDMNGQLLGVTQMGGGVGSVIVDMKMYQASSGFHNYVCGHFTTNVTVSGLALTNGGNQDVFMGRIDAVTPKLNSIITNHSLVISWPTLNEGYSTGILETVTDVSAGTWAVATNIPTSAAGLNYVTSSTITNQAFFRVKLLP